MNTNQPTEMHQLLCAYVLGEADADERVRVETALAESPELLAEKARLEGTIGLVQGAFEGEASLSESSLSELLVAAGAKPPVVQQRAWYQREAFLAAAAVLLTFSGVWGALKLTKPLAPPAVTLETAKLDPESKRVWSELASLEQESNVRHAELERNFKRRLDSYFEQAQESRDAGDLAGARVLAKTVVANDPDNEQALALVNELEDKLARFESGASDLRDTNHWGKQPSPEEVLRIRESKKSADEPAAANDESLARLGELTTTLSSTREKDVTLLGIELIPEADPGWAPGLHVPQTGEHVVGVLQDGPATGSDEYFLGYGEKKETEVASRFDLQDLVRDPGQDPGQNPVLGAELDALTATAQDVRARRELLLSSSAEATKNDSSGRAGGAYAGPGDVAPPPDGPAPHFERKGKLTAPKPSLAGPSSPAPGSPGAPAGGGGGGGAATGSPGPPARGVGGGGAKLPQGGLAATELAIDLPELEIKRAESLDKSVGRYLADSENVNEVTTGLEGAASFGLASGDPGEEARDAAGAPSAGFFFEEDGVDDFRAADSRDGGRRQVKRRKEDVLREQIEIRKRIEDAIRLQSDRCITSCYPLRNESPSMMYFRFWGDNAFEISKLDHLSTFSVDVDTASYALARRYLVDGHLPRKAQIRTEEFLNYFQPELPAPVEETFAIHTELAPSAFGGREDRWLLRVGVRGKEVQSHERQPLAITFVIDVSGSMKEGQRLELVKHAIRLLVSELDGRDQIAIIVFSDEARMVLPMTSAGQRGVIESAIHPLSPEGSTNAEGGLKMGYEVALANLAQGTHNRVVLLSDGVANVGQTDQDRLSEDVRRHREAGIYLNTIGVGMGNHNDVFLEQLADKGDGICDYVDDEAAAHRAIVERFSGAFEPIASDVKIQVEFDPAQVFRYRLLGYENRAIADADFRNDKIDAGEIGAGHQVVALYEIELATRVTGGGDGPLAKVNLRWKDPKFVGQDPNEITVHEISSVVNATDALPSYGSGSPGYRRSVLVAQFAEFLRRSTHAMDDSYEMLLTETQKLERELADPDFTEFAGLVQRAGDLILASARERTELARTVDEFRRFQILKEELVRLQQGLDDDLLKDLREKNDQLEDRIRDLIRRGIQERNG